MPNGRIDVWWPADDGGLMLLLASLLCKRGSYLHVNRPTVLNIRDTKTGRKFNIFFDVERNPSTLLRFWAYEFFSHKRTMSSFNISLEGAIVRVFTNEQAKATQKLKQFHAKRIELKDIPQASDDQLREM